MDRALSRIPRQDIADVLVGFDHADDAGVYRISDTLALVQTVDFFSPIVDDAFAYGQIAAANALSDIYAMGGRPVTALAIVGFPIGDIELDVLEEIMNGGLSILNECGVALLGGHSVRDEEVKFGYSVTGTIDPAALLTNSGARVDDRILLTKPLGTGLIATALKNGDALESHVAAAVKMMATPNGDAAAITTAVRVHAVTDITGFGLLGHASEVARASNLTIVLNHARIPALDGALEYSAKGFCAGGLDSNRDFFSPEVRWAGDVPIDCQNLLFDPQTSGGLLVSVDEADAPGLLETLNAAGINAVEIGVAVSREDTLIRVD